MSNKKPIKWFAIILAMVVFALIGEYSKQVNDKKAQVISAEPVKNEPVKHRTSHHLEALSKCQDTIKGISVDYNGTTVPYAKNWGDEREHYFTWNNRNPIKLADGRGGIVIVSGSCIVDASTNKIISLTVNGKTIIGK